MDPLGSIIEKNVEEETLQDGDNQDFEINPRLLSEKNSQCNKNTLIKKFFSRDEEKCLRRTSSFMLRSQAEGGGKHKIVNQSFVIRIMYNSGCKYISILIIFLANRKIYANRQPDTRNEKKKEG